MLSPGDTCRAHNNEDYPITIGWGNVEYILRPGEDTFVPADAIINFFGDSRAIDTMQSLELANGQHGWVLDRATEVRRLRIKWAPANLNNGELELVTPDVDVYEVDGTWVPTVAKDPTGKNVTASSVTQQQEFDRDQVIARMQAQLDSLIHERNLSDKVQQAVVNESEIPEDEPMNSIPERKSTRAKAANDE